MNLISNKYFLDDFFDSFDNKDNHRNISMMNCDIYEMNGEYHIEIDMPGFDKKDINIEFDNGYLSVSGIKKWGNDKEERNYIRKERNYGKIERMFYLGELDSDNIKAELKEGILTLVIPKKQSVETKRLIEID